MRKMISLCTAATFILGFNSISCESLHPVQPTQSPTKIKYDQSAPSSPVFQQEDQTTARPEYNNDPHLLSPNKFTPEISRILTPDIFNRPDPVHYLLTETINLPFHRAAPNVFMIRHCLSDNKFPARYAPYAEVLAQLLYCRRILKNTTTEIEKIRNSALSRFENLPLEVHSVELFGLFSSDIFLDASPPFQLMNKLIDIVGLPLDKKTDLFKVLKQATRPQLLNEYYGYAWKLLNVIRSDFIFGNLNESIDRLRKSLTSNSPTNSL